MAYSGIDCSSDQKKGFLGGSLAGAAGLLVFNPIELLKCRAQANRKESIKYSVEVPKLVRNEGFLALYNGTWAALYRDVPGWAVYFWAYAACKEYYGI
jgi:solute carrier family 25 (mitochondrial carnitine/acylcarnitine transporter), member 20/29